MWLGIIERQAIRRGTLPSVRDLMIKIRQFNKGATPSGGWPRALAEVAAVFLLQLVLFQLADEIGFTGFLQHHWQDRYHPMKLTVYVALLWAVLHLPDHFAGEGWGSGR